MECLPIDILKKIRSYLSCYLLDKNFFLTNTLNNSLHCCNLIKYKSLVACKYHSKEKFLFNSIITLQEAEAEFKKYKSIYSIHFNTRKAFLLSEKYLELFGTVNHYCCNGTGVVYINNNNYDDKFY